ncbi:MAG TPA: hypothetical protein ENH41_03445 [Candidatus Omnitrophica bacterium]|nr:hypothetical protein [Candidatus Omnitrophota bacterium]
MSNHCDNDLRVSGDKAELLRFKKFAKEGENLLSANKFIPYPKKYAEQDKKAEEQGEKRLACIDKLKKSGVKDDEARKKAFKEFPHFSDGYNSGGYTWCNDNWGTKWGFYSVELADEDLSDKKGYESELSYRFDTAWCPALPVIKAMGEKFPKLRFENRYFECGCGFNGLYVVDKGEVTEEKEGDYFGNRGG